MRSRWESEKTASSKESRNLELDTPYFRRSLAQKTDLNLDLVELRLDNFLEEKGITYVKLNEEYDDVTVNKNLNFLGVPSPNMLTRASDLQDGSRRSSFSSFNLDNNSLFLRRKISMQIPNPNSGNESS